MDEGVEGGGELDLEGETAEGDVGDFAFLECGVNLLDELGEGRLLKSKVVVCAVGVACGKW